MAERNGKSIFRLLFNVLCCRGRGYAVSWCTSTHTHSHGMAVVCEQTARPSGWLYTRPQKHCVQRSNKHCNASLKIKDSKQRMSVIINDEYNPQQTSPVTNLTRTRSNHPLRLTCLELVLLYNAIKKTWEMLFIGKVEEWREISFTSSHCFLDSVFRFVFLGFF